MILVIEVLFVIVEVVGGKVSILFDSGVCLGFDVMCVLYFGVDFVLLGWVFIYGVVVLGKYGGDYVVEILMDDLKNNMV